MNRMTHSARRPLTAKNVALIIFALLAVRLVLYALVTRSFTGLPDAMCKWDCDWYRSIVDNGYMSSLEATYDFQANWAFFPLFPMLFRAASDMLGHRDTLAGFLTANIFLGIFIFYAVMYDRQIREDTADAGMILFLIAYPYGFYYSVPYTESLFAALTMIFLVIRRNRGISASIIASGLAATRVTGVLFTLVIVMRQARCVYSGFITGGRSGFKGALMASILPIALAPLGLFLFMLFLYIHTGDAFAFAHIERAWGRSAHNPLMVVLNGLAWPDLADMYARHKECNFFAAVCGVASIAMSLRLFFIRRYDEGFLLVASTLIALSAGLGSMPRYLLAYPVFVVSLFDLVWQTCFRKYFVWIIGGFVILQLYLVHLWALGYGSLI